MALTTTPEYDLAIKNDIRFVTARATINFTDVQLDPSVGAEAISIGLLTEDGDQLLTEDDDTLLTEPIENRGSQTDQAINGKTIASHKYFALTGNDLTGAFHTAPGTSELASFNEIGWWSSLISDGSGNTYGEGVRITFGLRKVTDYQVIGDDKYMEYPVDFDVEFYSGTTLISTENVIGNTEVFYSDSLLVGLDDIDSAVLRIYKWSAINAIPKIIEFSTGVTKTLEADEIANFSLLEQREISNNNSIPVGNIASNELSLSLINKDRQFDANNTSSRFYGLVKPNTRVLLEFGVKTTLGLEWIPLFVGWSGGWNVPEDSLTANVAFRDRLELLTQTKIDDSSLQTDVTFFDLFETVFQNAGLDSTVYNIDTVLDGAQYTIPYTWFETMPHRSALLRLAEGCSAAVYQDREGVIQVQSVEYFESNKGIPIDSITRCDYMSKDNQPVYQNIANSITVTTQPLVKTTSVTIYETSNNEEEVINGNSSESYTIFFTDTPTSDGVVSISPPVAGVSISSQDVYSWGANITVQNMNAGSVNFKFLVIGSTYTISGKQTIRKEDDESIALNGINSFTYPANPFLQSKNLANLIALSLLESFKNPDRDLTLVMQPGGNPAIELGDRISVTDIYTTKEYNIVSQNFEFDGGLTTSIQARDTGERNLLTTEDGDNITTEDGLNIIV